MPRVCITELNKLRRTDTAADPGEEGETVTSGARWKVADFFQKTLKNFGTDFLFFQWHQRHIDISLALFPFLFGRYILDAEILALSRYNMIYKGN